MSQRCPKGVYAIYFDLYPLYKGHYKVEVAPAWLFKTGFTVH